jgi:hypothetical protein
MQEKLPVAGTADAGKYAGTDVSQTQIIFRNLCPFAILK